MIHARIQKFSSGVFVCVCVCGGGGSRSIWHIKKALTTFFLFYFFGPQLILQKSSGYFQRKLLFAKVPVGVEFFPRWGVQLYTGGSNCFFPIKNPYNL